jgi:aspartyl-tRNA(Asn)/glutamyl-tRNA(Gln) amidotransferase subunit A
MNSSSKQEHPNKFYPVAAKDNFATSELPTTCASQILKDYKSPFEATAIQRLKAQNYPSWFHQPKRGRRKHASLMVGKTNMDEFGMGSHSSFSHFGPVINLEQRSAGGSSGGSAMAAKLRHARVALGTDTGGSVRLPAAYTGILGFKPTYGLISRYGVVPYANSLDTVGILTRLSVKVVADELKALITPDVHDPTSVAESSYPLLL